MSNDRFFKNETRAKIIDTLSFKFSLWLSFWDRVTYTWFKELGFINSLPLATKFIGHSLFHA
jgi:hypothetical protein